MIKVLLADDHEMFRHALAGLLLGVPDIEICGQAVDGLQAVALAVRTHPDVVLMDLSMPLLDGLAATEEIARVEARARVVVLTSRAGVGLLRQAGTAGAHAYLLKGCSPDDLLDTLRAVSRGEHRLAEPAGSDPLEPV